MGQRLATAVAGGKGTQKGMGGAGVGGGNDIPSPSSPTLGIHGKLRSPFIGEEGEKPQFRGSGGGGLGGLLGGGVNRFAGGIFRGFGQRGKTDKSYSKSYLDESKG